MQRAEDVNGVRSVAVKWEQAIGRMGAGHLCGPGDSLANGPLAG